MLNVRRESITQELGELKAAGLIRCQRGRITVVNRSNLEARACECYRGIKREFTRLLAPVTQAPSGLEEIWNSEEQAKRDRLGTLVKFVPPTVVNGKVYIPNYDDAVNVYGLLQ